MGRRQHLPQLDGEVFLTDGGLETVLIFQEGLDLPEFAAFDLLKDDEGTEVLRRYWAPYVELARVNGVGFILESPTWRASPRWATRIGYSEEELGEMNRRAIALMEEVRDRSDLSSPVVISGCVGPQGDGYDPAEHLSASDARDYHRTQVETFAGTAADMITAITMTYADEATGVVLAAEEAGMPAAISFTVETDGRLPSGQALGDAIDEVDDRTGGSPAYYMVNCAHPTHFAEALEEDAGWRYRIRGIRPNASTRSHAELDEAVELDEGDPADLGRRSATLKVRLPELRILGGCCGTDHRHVGEMCEAWLMGAAPAPE